jgi:hypothetical protein
MLPFPRFGTIYLLANCERPLIKWQRCCKFAFSVVEDAKVSETYRCKHIFRAQKLFTSSQSAFEKRLRR